MRIALFSGNYNFIKDGANQALNRLVDFLEREGGHVVRVYSPVTEVPAFEAAGTLIPVPSIVAPGRTEFRVATGLPRKIRRHIEQFAPDLFHVSAPDLLGTRAQTFAEQMGVPVVASMHTRFESYLDYYRLNWLAPLLSAHLRRFYRRADWVLAPTPVLVSEFQQLRGDSHASEWSRGVDQSLFSPSKRDLNWRRSQGFQDNDVVVLFFGRLVVEKGVDLFAQTVWRVRSMGLRVGVLIVGAGPAESRLREIPNAVFAGHLRDEALGRAIASADILLHPSVTEAFGNVVLEAMTSGLAVVCGDAPSSRALITAQYDGVICEATDVEAYAAAVTSLTVDRAERSRIGREARKVSAGYSWDAASQSVENVYWSLLGERQIACMRENR